MDMEVLRLSISKTSMYWSGTAPCNDIFRHGAQIGGIVVFGHHIHKNKCKQMCARSLGAVWFLSGVSLHVHTAVDAGDIHTWWTTIILIMEKARIPPIWASCQEQNDLYYIFVIRCRALARILKLPVIFERAPVIPKKLFWRLKSSAHFSARAITAWGY